ncbi:DUF4838 domain-containing protein [Candidatus Sumerlaeota bacterium]|nr:DUF4838 domain-containing protein [Candidatus Sumerlaeota bacterium]
MKRIVATITLLAAAAVFAASASSEQARLALVANGKAKAVIVLPAVPNKYVSEAARILASHLQQMSGARLAIKRENELGQMKVEGRRIVAQVRGIGEGVESFILVGESALAKSLGMTSEGLGPGGLLVKSGGNALALLGPTGTTDPEGTTHAVIEFLEQLGCRYLWPGPLGKVAPKRDTIEIAPIEKRFTPPIGQRHIRFGGMSERPQKGLAALQLTVGEWEKGRDKAIVDKPRDLSWGAWHRLGGELGVRGGHAFGWAWERWGKEHPEWFALQADGARDQSAAGDRARLCKSNPALIEAIANDVIERVNRNPRMVSVSLSPNDGGRSSFCMCEECKKLDPPDGPKIKMSIFAKVGESKRKEIEYVSLTDRMVFFWNSIAERVTKVRPNLLFIVDAYSRYSHAPVRRTLHPNLVVRYVPDTTDEWDQWRKKASKIYWRPNILLRGREDSTLLVYGRELAKTFQYMAHNGMIATDFDSIIDNWAVHGLNYYVAARLNWNPDLEYEAIFDDYCAAGWGKAAPHIKRYFLRAEEVSVPERLKDGTTGNREKHGTSGYTVEALAELRSLLRAADQAAGDDETIRRRTEFLRLGLSFTELQATVDRLADAARNKQPVDRALAQRLMDLNYLVMRDIARNHNLAINVAHLMWVSADFAKWRPLGWKGKPTDGLPAKPDESKHTLTGREHSIEEMMAAMGMARVER